jgi:hypothetical protein
MPPTASLEPPLPGRQPTNAGPVRAALEALARLAAGCPPLEERYLRLASAASLALEPRDLAFDLALAVVDDVERVIQEREDDAARPGPHPADRSPLDRPGRQG